MRRAIRIAGLILLAAGSLVAHDTWLVPTQFRVTPGQPVQVALNTSEDFPTSEGAPAPERIARFDTTTVAPRVPVSCYRVEGKSLVAEVTPGPGLTLVAAVTHPRLQLLRRRVGRRPPLTAHPNLKLGLLGLGWGRSAERRLLLEKALLDRGHALFQHFQAFDVSLPKQ